MARMSRLVICPSCSNQSSGSPAARGRMSAPRSATTSSAIVFRAATLSSAKSCASVVRMRSPGPPIASQIVSFDRPMPRAVSSAASLAGVASSHDSARMRAPSLQMRNDRLERAPVKREQRAILFAPAEPRRGERKGRRRRDRDHLVRGEAAHQHRADAEEERIAAGEHADGTAAMRLRWRRARSRSATARSSSRLSTVPRERDGACRRRRRPLARRAVARQE